MRPGKTNRVAWGLLILAGLGACQPGDAVDDKGPTDTVDTDPSDTDATPGVARIEVSTSTLLVDADPSFCRPLVATAFDASGAEVAAEVAWRSGDPSVATVDAAGSVCGAAAGSTQVSAAVGDVVSSDVQVTAAPLADAVVPVDDAEVVSAPEIVGGGPGLSELELAYVTSGPAPTVGDIVVATGDAAILGRVLRTGAVAGGTQVVFQVVAPWEAMDGPLEITVPLDPADAELADLGDMVEVVYDDKTGWYEVVPTVSPATGPRVACAIEGGISGGIDLQGSMRVRVTNPHLRARFASASDWSMTVAGAVEQDVSLAVVATAGLTEEVSCKVQVAAPYVPAAGWLTYVTGGVQVPLGIQVKVAPEVAILSGDLVSYTNQTSSPFEVGVRVQSGSGALCCDAPAPPTTTGDFSWLSPTDLEGTRVEATVGMYAYADLKLAFAQIFRDWDPFSGDPPGEAPSEPGFTIATAKLGTELSLTWLSIEAQLERADLDGEWVVEAKASLGLGSDLSEFGMTLLERAGSWWSASVVGPAFSVSPSLSVGVELAREPGIELGEVTLEPSLTEWTVEVVSSDIPPEDFVWWCRQAGPGGWWNEGTYAAGRVMCPYASDRVGAVSEFLGLSFEGATPLGCEEGTTQADAHLGTVVCIPSGTFTMGCVPGRDDVAGGCSGDESPPRTVELTRSFWMMEAEVTQGQYAAVMGSNPSYFSGSNLPVEQVSWNDAVAFADAVSVSQGLTPCGSGDPYGCDGWRLPTEAEWEYAARGGQGFPYAGSSSADTVAWYRDNWGNTYDDQTYGAGSECGGQTCTRPVCTKVRNGFGLCDMSGNVYEWTWDWYSPYSGTASTDPTGPAFGSNRMARGGDWSYMAMGVRVANRSWNDPGFRYVILGFRLVRSIP